MKLKTLSTYLLIFSIIAFSACKDEEKTLLVSAELNEWLTPFDPTGLNYNYTNDSSEVAKLEVIFSSIGSSGLDFADCSDADRCEYKSATLQFISGNDSLLMRIRIIGEDRLVINYQDQDGFLIGGQLLEYNESSQSIDYVYSAFFNASFTEDYTYDNETKNAILFNTITLDNYLGPRPPKSFILVKGVGIVEWVDYADKVWKLDN